MSALENLKTISQITKEECESVIKNKFKNTNNKILNYQLIPLTGTNGFLGDHHRLAITITNENNEEQQVYCFAKFLPENESQIEFVLITGVFKKEVFVYEQLFPKFVEFGIELGNCIPECYFAKDNHILVFDDVNEKSFKPLSKFEYFNYEQVIITLKTMAKLHASSLIFEEKMSEKLKKPYSLLDEYLEYFYEAFFVDDLKHKGGQGYYAAVKGLQNGFTLFPEQKFNVSDEFKSKVSKTCSKTFQLIKPSRKYRNVVCHGDLWASNILMKYQDGQPIQSLLLDFQTFRYCPPAHDFMSFIYLTTSREFRKKYFSILQEIYYNELDVQLRNHDCNLKKIISYEDFQDSCQIQKVFAVVQNSTYIILTQVKDKLLMNYIKDAKLWNELLYEDRSQMIVDNCCQDPKYRNRFMEGLIDLYELCNNNN